MQLIKITLESEVDEVIILVEKSRQMEAIQDVANMMGSKWLDAETEVLIDDVPAGFPLDKMRPFIG